MKKLKIKVKFDILFEKYKPTDKILWDRAKAEAKKRFKVYPSAYANAFAAKKYKEWGGTWKKISK